MKNFLKKKLFEFQAASTKNKNSIAVKKSLKALVIDALCVHTTNRYKRVTKRSGVSKTLF